MIQLQSWRTVATGCFFTPLGYLAPANCTAKSAKSANSEINGWSVDDQLMISWWSVDDQWMISWWLVDDQLMINGWSMDDQLMISWWSVDDQWMISWWSVDDQLMMSWWLERTCWVIWGCNGGNRRRALGQFGSRSSGRQRWNTSVSCHEKVSFDLKQMHFWFKQRNSS